MTRNGMKYATLPIKGSTRNNKSILKQQERQNTNITTMTTTRILWTLYKRHEVAVWQLTSVFTFIIAIDLWWNR